MKQSSVLIPIIGLIVAIVTGAISAGGGAQAEHQANAPVAGPGSLAVLRSVRNDTSPPLRELLGVLGSGEKGLPWGTAGEGSGPTVAEKYDPGALPDHAAGSNLLTPSLSFDGISQADNTAITDSDLPMPDLSLAVGPEHVVQMINRTYAVYNKSGATLLGPLANNSIWSGFGGPCESGNGISPIALYDHLADRWVLSQFATSGSALEILAGPYYQCIAVSQTNDPTGSYHRYAFPVGGEPASCALETPCKMLVTPKLGVWPDAYYMSALQQQYDGEAFQWAGQAVAAFERDQMLAGEPAQKVYIDLFPVNPDYHGLLPSDLDGPAPTAGTPNYFMGLGDDASGFPTDQLQIWAFSVDWNDPSAATFGDSNHNPSLIIDTTSSPALQPFVGSDPAAHRSDPCTAGVPCIPQQGSSETLDALADRLMHRLQFRDFGTHHSLVVNHTIDGDGTGRAGIRWYELRGDSGTWSIHQQGTYAPGDVHNRWLGSVSMNGMGDIAAGYGVSSSDLFPSVRFSGRQASDVPGAFPQGEGEIVAGTGAKRHDIDAPHSWGRYSTTVVDPADDRTFWHSGYYFQETTLEDWTTRIAAFTIPPDTAITSAPPETTTETTATFEFDSNVSGSTFECDLDGGGFTACTSPHALDNLSTGSHTFQVRAVGSVDGTPAGHTWTVEAPAETAIAVAFSVDLQGRPAPPDPSWVLDCTVDLYSPGADRESDPPESPLDTFLATTDEDGHFTLDIEPETYDIRAKCANTLATDKLNEALLEAPADPVDMGLQLAGDYNGDNLVDVSDYAALIESFGKLTVELTTDLQLLDLNGDGVVDVVDYSILVSNFLQAGAPPP